MADSEKKESTETVEEAAKCVVDLFDQANTAGAIEKMGSRGQEVSKAIDDLRQALNRDGKKTILDNQQIDEVRADRDKVHEQFKEYEKSALLRPILETQLKNRISRERFRDLKDLGHVLDAFRKQHGLVDGYNYDSNQSIGRERINMDNLIDLPIKFDNDEEIYYVSLDEYGYLDIVMKPISPKYAILGNFIRVSVSDR